MILNEDAVQIMTQQPGVTGVCLADGMGEIVETSIEDEGVTELIAFIAGMTPTLADTLGEGDIDKVLLNGQGHDHLMIFLQDEQVMGLSAEGRGSILGACDKMQEALGEG